MTTTTTQMLESKLADYAAGAVTPGEQLLIAAHLDGRADAARRVGTYEALGGAMFAADNAVDMKPGALDEALGRLNGLAADTPTVAGSGRRSGPLPATVTDAIGLSYDEIRWKPRLPGLSEYVLDGFDGEHVSLIRARPGAWMPKHTHEGEELTLVLTGALEDGGTEYGPGDIVLNDETVDHKPRIVGDELCHCLVVMTGRMRFTGTISRALNYLGE